MKKPKYYAFYLKNGSYGVVNTWKICQMIVNKQSYARYKKFETREDAYEWLDQIVKRPKHSLKRNHYKEFQNARDNKLNTLYDEKIKPGPKPDNSKEIEAKRQSLSLDPSKL